MLIKYFVNDNFCSTQDVKVDTFGSIVVIAQECAECNVSITVPEVKVGTYTYNNGAGLGLTLQEDGTTKSYVTNKYSKGYVQITEIEGNIMKGVFTADIDVNKYIVKDGVFEVELENN